MGTARQPAPVKLVISLLTGAPDLLETAKEHLAQHFGPIDWTSERLPFEHTDYYTREFGPGLEREILTFERLVSADQLPAIKLTTNELEWELASEGRRRINVDPGYVSLSKLVLATTKDHAHRLYLGHGIYGEVTLTYRQGRFRPWPWTYPDYAEERSCAIFLQIRERYRAQLREGRRGQE